jgi:hypothetical protein
MILVVTKPPTLLGIGKNVSQKFQGGVAIIGSRGKLVAQIKNACNKT